MLMNTREIWRNLKEKNKRNLMKKMKMIKLKMRKNSTSITKEKITTIMLTIRLIQIIIPNRLLAAMKTAGSYLKLRNHFEIISEFTRTKGHTLGKSF